MRCQRSAACVLVPEHGGGCDPRPEAERWRALFVLLDEGAGDLRIVEEMERGAREAFWRLPS